jgi:hypothetical protein
MHKSYTNDKNTAIQIEWYRHLLYFFEASHRNEEVCGGEGGDAG